MKNKKINSNRAHKIFGHINADATRKTANYYDIQLQGKMDICEECLIGKARQKNLAKESTKEKSKTLGHCLYIDIKAESFGKKKFWLLIFDEARDNCWSYFLKYKSETSKEIIEFVKELKARENKEVKYIRCDNAGENWKVEEKLCKLGFGITFEYTAPNTPQHNGVVERKFATLYRRVRTMFTECRLERDTQIQKGLWTECANTATKNENITDKEPIHCSLNSMDKIQGSFHTFVVLEKLVWLQSRRKYKEKWKQLENYASLLDMPKTMLETLIACSIQQRNESLSHATFNG